MTEQKRPKHIPEEARLVEAAASEVVMQAVAFAGVAGVSGLAVAASRPKPPVQAPAQPQAQAAPPNNQA